MPFALIIVGLALLVAAVRGTQDKLFTLVQGDFSGPNNFAYWLVSILVIGSIGYIPKAKSVSVAFLVLVVIVMILTRGNPGKAGGGFFDAFTKQLNITTTPQTPSAATTGQTQNLSNVFQFLR
jgi:hypothetical protein